MEKIGINKLLYKKRLELGFSLKEASSALGISKIRLNLIENGYKKVKDYYLIQKFIEVYKLGKDIFDSAKYDYPFPLNEDEDDNNEIVDSKFVKICKKAIVKIALIALTIGSLFALSIGFVRYNSINASDYYSEKYNNVSLYAKENGISCLAITSQTSKLLLCNYKSIEYEDSVDGYVLESLNFMPQYDEYLGYAFFFSKAKMDILDIYEGEEVICFESRINGNNERLHFCLYTYDDLIYPTVHFSVDYNYKDKKFSYNLIEAKDEYGSLTKRNLNSAEFKFFSKIFENYFPSFEESKERFISKNKSILKYESLEEFNSDQASGLSSYNKTLRINRALIIGGIVLSTLFLACFVLTIIVTTKFGKKVLDIVNIDEDKSIHELKEKRNFKPLPKNYLPPPIIPEFIIRIIAFVLMIIGSMSLYYIFEAITNGDIIGTLQSLEFRATVASFTTLGMILIFFLKLDIIKNKKSIFMINYILFFAGFIFYVMTLFISLEMSLSPAMGRFKIILDFLPGNIVWGILAFNLLSSSFLSKPKFKRNKKRNTIIYRLMGILPLIYMIGSSIVQIGKKLWNWELPLEISSLFFTKALIITIFAILYVLVLYVYRKIVDRKYGKENAEIYIQGNRYQYIKNSLIAGVLLLLGLLDLLMSKTNWGSSIGLGSNVGIFFLIPVVLLYQPHKGRRNSKLDFAFNAAYGFSLLIGIVCIISSVSVYIASL